ncbi:carbohydrate ABC transporter membrane protein 1, CUT1 family [Microlunatus sagamiharensis]|uniref:Carbohydrate ABC transporter membrane protein 1, CUT1 family n=1 Tax=Microlunatus sagamiharensis TaxID=546874 RepID=A0A1H2LN87_9ACTN|nr:sugar ABC transporter permease [Microlunatus sagamiharensis]SDU82215.1 carbohydrate ABC transporter membrane protein 1, CUT1 family [Microlunatus sagamiharensis]
MSSRQTRGEARAAYLLLSPNLLLLGLFVFVPLVGAAVISLQRTDGFGGGTFAGLANYAKLLGDPLFWRSLVNTTAFTVLVTPLSMALGLGAAVLLNTVLPARPVFRSVLILPMAISGVATALLGVLVFDENTGLLDLLLRTVGLPAVPWQSGSAAAFASVVLVTLWWRVGFNMLIYLAGLQGIGPDLYEAATLDGANRWQQFRHLTFPLLGASTFFLLIINVIFSFQVFDIVFVLTGGGPRNATSVLVTYAYDTGFEVRDQGYAAAIGMVLLVLTMAFTLLQWRTNRSRDVVE